MGLCSSNTAVVDEKEKAKAERLRAARQHDTLRHNLLHQSVLDDPFQKYEIVKHIGQGSIATVSSVRLKGDKDKDNPDHLYAMKSLRVGRLCKELIRELENEIKIARDLDHPSIVKFVDVYYAKVGIYVVMEMCSGGNLYKRKPYTETQAADIMRQLLSAVAYIHSRGYVHRDLKCENILFQSKNPNSNAIKVIDFGLSCRYKTDRPLEAQLGSMQTMAPEVFGGEYTSQCDLWSLGVIAFELVSGLKPFGSTTSILTLTQRIGLAQYNFNAKVWTKKSEPSKAFIRALLQKYPTQRLTAPQALQHQWIKKNSMAAPIANNKDHQSSVKTSRKDLLDYAEKPVLEKLVALIVAHRSFPGEVEDLRTEFERLDVDGSGAISVAELKQALSPTAKDKDDDDSTLKAIFQGLDVYQDGEVSWMEFLAASLLEHGFITDERIKQAFDDLDEDHSGAISLDNLCTLLGHTYPPKDVEKILSSADMYKDGKVSYEELLMLFHKQQNGVSKKALSGN